MLADFIIANRDDLIERTREKVSKRAAPKATEHELARGVPLFLDQLVRMLNDPQPGMTQVMDRSAASHGAVLLERGYSVAQVIHDYGDICQAVTELAEELDAPITPNEFHTFNRCLDNAIAEAVTEYTRIREQWTADGETARAGAVAEHLRHRIAAAQLAFMAIQSGHAPLGGSVAAVVTRSLQGMTSLISRALVDVRLDTGSVVQQRVRLHQIIEEAEVQGLMEANVRGISLNVPDVDPEIEVDADRQSLVGSVANILQNAFKFTLAGGTVSLRTSSSDAGVLIEVEDGCGGLPPGRAEELSAALMQHGTNRSGLGLGLFISRKGIEANGGEIHVRDVPGSGCVFTINLPPLAKLPSSGSIETSSRAS
jgi:signal transduction histidine kinase